MHISFKVNGKETIVTLTDVRPIFVICIGCIYCLHKTYIGRIVQWWPAKYSHFLLRALRKKNSRPANKIQFLSKSDTKKFSSSTKKVFSFLFTSKICLSLFLFLIHKLPPYQFLFNPNFQNIFSNYLRR